VAYGLLTAFSPARLTLAARTTSRAQTLAAALAPYDARDALNVVDLPEAGEQIREAALVVNATPVGMGRGGAQTPWPGIDDFRPGHLVYDLVYTPRPTRLLREAATQGADTLDGWPMLIHQAAAAYRLWTGRPMPASVLRTFLSAGPH
jgi:shikimate dehydrogenase